MTAQAGAWARIRRLARKWTARHVVGPWPTDRVERHTYVPPDALGAITRCCDCGIREYPHDCPKRETS